MPAQNYEITSPGGTPFDLYGPYFGGGWDVLLRNHDPDDVEQRWLRRDGLALTFLERRDDSDAMFPTREAAMRGVELYDRLHNPPVEDW